MIKSITLSNFMAHSKLTVADIPTINLIIGKNDSGKTGLLKLLYSVVKTLENYSRINKHSEVSFSSELSMKLQNTFMPRFNGLGDLVQKGSSEKLKVELSIEGLSNNYQQNIYFSFGDRTEKKIPDCNNHIKSIPNDSMNAIFIPAKEVLTAFSDIRIIRDQKYGIGFDDTYLDLIKSLDIPVTKGSVGNDLSSINRILERLFDGKIEQTGKQEQPFIFKKGNQKFSIQQTAEGIKKIGILTTLITNRQLGKGTILFMDEPETALHPDAVRQMVEILVAMSKAGVQVFLATHSYFVIKQLANSSKKENIDTLLWGLERENGKSVTCNFKYINDGVLPPNSIIDEAVRMYEDEINFELNDI
ncbi:MAG: ATP-binding protein [Bacteroidota bacterium]